jgi:hypothetical protein
MKYGGSLERSQELATSSYHEPDESYPQTATVFS